MPELFEDLMRTNDPARGIAVDPSQREAVLANAELDNVQQLPVRRSNWGRRLAVAAALVGVTGGLVWTQLSGPTAQVASALTASDVLTKAATAAQDPEAKPGQYWVITANSTFLNSVAGEDEAASGSCLVKSGRTSYIPVDGKTPAWYADAAETKVKQVSGDACSLEAKATNWTTNQTPNTFPGDWSNPNQAWVEKLPGSVDELRKKLYADTKGAGSGSDDEAYVVITDSLRSGMAPADLRSKMLEILKTIDGTKITDAKVEVEGRTGVAIGREQNTGDKVEIIIDSETGELLGERTHTKVGDDTVVSTSAYTPRKVVDAVPDSVKDGAVHYTCDEMGNCKE